MAIAGAVSQAAANHATTILRQKLPAPFEGWEAEFALVTMEPGPGYAPHRHPGFVLGYVVDGQFRFGLEGQPETTLHAGEAFYEPPGALHTISASASQHAAGTDSGDHPFAIERDGGAMNLRLARLDCAWRWVQPFFGRGQPFRMVGRAEQPLVRFS